MRMDDDGGNLIKRDATNLNSVRTDFQKTSLARQVTPRLMRTHAIETNQTRSSFFRWGQAHL